ncbi:MAG: polysaccharide deacetylase family protein [Eubacteriales bacterium]|nr:polysaccharide deacetylase family protein [Eubacteriales bacterium]
MKKHLLTVLLCAFLISLAGCSGKTPEPPDNITAVPEGETVKISWTPSDNAVCYRLYRKTERASDYKYLCDLQNTEYTDTDVLPGDSYRYKVEIVYSDCISAGAETAIVTVPMPTSNTECPALTQPVITSVTRMDKYTVVLQIAEQDPECEYEILRAAAPDEEYSVIDRVDENIYYDITAEDRDYTYTVRAITEQRESPVSSPVTVGTNAKSVFGVPVLMYHEFVTPEDLANGIDFDKYAIFKSEFESDLAWLRDNGYTTITTRQLTDYLNGIGTMPPKPILLTIDDGKLGVYKNAYPLLKEYGMQAVLAVIGSRIDLATQKPESRVDDPAPYCTWSEIAAMSESGAVEVISHTYGLHVFQHSGRQGANCADGESLESFLPIAQKDHAQIISKVFSATGIRPVAMSYPYSKRSETADLAWLKSGYQLLLGGDSPNERRSYINYFVQEAGINSKSSVLRRLVRMTETPAADLLEEAIRHDAY